MPATPPFVLETDRVRLRPLCEGDVAALVELDSDPEVMRYLHPTAPPSAEAALAWIRLLESQFYDRLPGFGFWAALDKDDAFLGWFHYRSSGDDPAVAELGYRLRRAAWGRGYATEVARALVRKGFEELGIRRVVATALVENEGSIRVMQKAGLRLSRHFIHEPTGRQAVEYWLDREAFVYSMR